MSGSDFCIFKSYTFKVTLPRTTLGNWLCNITDYSIIKVQGGPRGSGSDIFVLFCYSYFKCKSPPRHKVSLSRFCTCFIAKQLTRIKLIYVDFAGSKKTYNFRKMISKK